jgi:aspartate kinase
MLLTVGERISCALGAMAINDLGQDAVSLAGSQAGIVTDTVHGKAKIVEVRARRIHGALDDGRIVLVAGFQGVSIDLDITTLGRGGTDTTAVALAAALGADACEIYTDVDGVFTADPRVVAGARKLDVVTYEEMLEMAASGATVLQLRSVELARNHGVRVHVRSTFSEEPGTWITEEDERMEKAIISGVTHTVEEAVYRVHGAAPAELFSALALRQVNVDTIIQTSADVIVFSAPLEDRPATAATLDGLGASWSELDDLGKVSVVGAGMKSHPGIAAQTFATLRELRIEPQFVSTSPIKIAFYVPHADVERAVSRLHAVFQLGDERNG